MGWGKFSAFYFLFSRTNYIKNPSLIHQPTTTRLDLPIATLAAVSAHRWFPVYFHVLCFYELTFFFSWIKLSINRDRLLLVVPPVSTQNKSGVGTFYRLVWVDGHHRPFVVTLAAVSANRRVAQFDHRLWNWTSLTTVLLRPRNVMRKQRYCLSLLDKVLWTFMDSGLPQ